MSGFERATRLAQSPVRSFAQQEGVEACAAGDRVESNTLVGKNIVPDGLTNKASFKHRSRRYKLVAGARDERSKALFMWAEAHDTNAPAIDPNTSGTMGAQALPQHRLLCRHSCPHTESEV